MERIILQQLKFSIIILFIFFESLSASTDWTIIVDGSGSMKGFYKSGEIQSLVTETESKIKESGYTVESKTFIHNWVTSKEHDIVPFEMQPTRYGNFTDLELTYEDMLKLDSKMIILITDNLMATTELGNTMKFYNKLSNDTVKSVYIVPKIMKYQDKNGTILQKGVLIYGLLLDSAQSKQFSTIKNIFSENELLLIKPITDKDIVLRGSNIKKNRPNAYIGKDGKLQPVAYRKYMVNKKNRIKFNFSLGSDLPHVHITGVSSHGDTVKVKITNLNIYSSNKKLTLQQEGVVTPDQLQGTLKRGEENESMYVAKIDFIPSLNWSISDAWSMVKFDWSRLDFAGMKLHLNFDVEIDVPPSCFSLSNEFNNQFFTKDPNELGKIYSDTDILRIINTKNVPINLHIESN